MLYALIAIAWLVLVCVGLTMFRLAALSDRSHAAALAEWISSRYPTRRDEEQAPDHRGGAYRATG